METRVEERLGVAHLIPRLDVAINFPGGEFFVQVAVRQREGWREEGCRKYALSPEDGDREEGKDKAGSRLKS